MSVEAGWVERVRATASGELDSLLRGVCDSGFDGVPRFAPWVCRTLVTAVLGRAYGPDLLELCYMITVAQAAGTGRERYERLFWLTGPARADAFHGALARQIRTAGWRRRGFAMAEGGIVVTGAEGKPFTVHYSRMPYLAALLDFTVSALGFTALDALLAPLWQPAESVPLAANVTQVSNAIGRALHEFLRDHLPPQQDNRKFRLAMRHVADRLGEEFDAAEIGDAIILSFWCTVSIGEDASDFRTFDSALRVFQALIAALEAASRAQQVAGARAIGSNGEAGEINPEHLSRALAEVIEEEGEDPLAVLEEQPASRVKFLSKQDHAEIVPVVGAAARRFPLSLLRAEIFGAHQRRLTEAMRHADAAVRVAAILSALPDCDYADKLARYAELASLIRRSMLASLHALLAARSLIAALVALELEPAIDRVALAALIKPPETQGKVVALTSAIAADRFIDQLQKTSPDPVLAALAGDAAKAHKALNKQGFDRLPAPGDELCDAFEVGAPALQGVGRRLEAYHAGLAGRDLVGLFRDDQKIFAAQFAALYGDGS